MTAKIKGYQPVQVPVGNDLGRQALRDQMQQLSPITNKAINSLSQMAQFSDNGNMEAYKQNQMNRFNQDILPGIMQRFGGQKGSGLNNALASASQGLGQNLAARREDMQSSAISQLLGLNGQLMNTQDYQHGFLQEPEGGWSNFMRNGLPSIASIVSDVMPSNWAAKIAEGFGSGSRGSRANMRQQDTSIRKMGGDFGLPGGGYIF